MEAARPKFLTALVFFMVLVELLGFVDVPALLSRETFFYCGLTALLIPIYWALYRGQNWSRLVFIILSFLALISGVLNFDSIRMQYSSLRMASFFVELLSYILYLAYAFTPSFRKYFQLGIEVPQVNGEWQLASLSRRFFALIIDLMVGVVCFLPLYYFSLQTQIWQGKIIAILLPLFYLIFSPFLRLNLSCLILGVQVVNLQKGKIWPLMATFRLIYGLLLFPINCLFALFDPYSRGVHDHVCHTVVLLKK